MSDPQMPIARDQLELLLLARALRMRLYVATKVPPRLRPLISIEDVLQEVWIAAFRGIGSFRPGGRDAFDNWLLAITNNKLLDGIKAALATKRGGAAAATGNLDQRRRESLTGLVARMVSREKTPSSNISVREAVDAVQIALSRLPDESRRAIWMHHIEGRSVSEVAVSMNRSESAVAGLIFRGKRRLRRHLGRAARFFSDSGFSSDATPDTPEEAADQQLDADVIRLLRL